MPEGDTIFRAARTLNRALQGQTVTKFETQLPQLSRVDEDAPLAGRVVELVDAAGKWLRMHFTGDLILLTHMLMNGSWHIYRPGERWQRSRSQMRIALHTQPFVAVAFQVQVAEFHTAATLARHDSVRRLGPDLLSDNFDDAAALSRLQSGPELEVGVALLNQRLMAGLGNVYKSEVCFASRVNPFRKVATLSNDEAAALLRNSRKFLIANVAEASRMRATTGRLNPEERLWVYGRRGEPCLVCGTPVESRKQGLDARVTFWCPVCQSGAVSL